MAGRPCKMAVQDGRDAKMAAAMHGSTRATSASRTSAAPSFQRLFGLFGLEFMAARHGYQGDLGLKGATPRAPRPGRHLA